MVPWRVASRVAVGAVATVLLSVSTAVLLPFLGIATAEVVGNWLPLWTFAVPLAICPAAGGAITGFLQGDDWKDCAILGGLAAALGSVVIGVIAGLVALLVLLGMTPAHGQEADLSRGALAMATLGGGAGFIAGAAFGAVGGAAAHVARRARG